MSEHRVTEEARVLAEAERLTRRADLARRAPDVLKAVDALAVWGDPLLFCTACAFRVEPGGTCCPGGNVVDGVPPVVACRRCWLDFGPDCCTGRHAGARGRPRVMTPDAVAKEAVLQDRFPGMY